MAPVTFNFRHYDSSSSGFFFSIEYGYHTVLDKNRRKVMARLYNQ